MPSGGCETRSARSTEAPGWTRRAESGSTPINVELWLQGLVRITPATRAGYESLLRSRILPTFGGVQLRRIERPVIREWISAMDAENLSASRIRQAHRVLSQTLDQAVVDGLLGRNAAKGRKLPRKPEKEMKFLTATQVRELAELAELRQGGSGLLVIFLAYSGLRWGEVVALRRSSIDVLRRRVRVRESATEVSGRLVFGLPKSHEMRDIYVARSVADLVGASLWASEEDGPVFTAPRGGPLRSANFRRQVWLPVVKDLSQEYPDLDGLRVHDLRHTAASLAISTGTSIKAIQGMLGHKHASMTLDRYGHLYTEDQEDLADRMDQKFRGVA